MGKQLRFYMVEEDEDDFVAFLQSTGDVVILPQTTDRNPPEEFTQLRELSGRRLGTGCHLWNRSISPRPSFEFYEVHGGCYCLDFMQSEVINVIRSHLSGRTLSMGRIHIENTILHSDGSVASKPREFIDWQDQLTQWIRKNFPKSHDGARASTRSWDLASQGYELIGHTF